MPVYKVETVGDKYMVVIQSLCPPVQVYKVETVGDKYMVVSGVPEPLEDHARCICQLAIDMKEAADKREKSLDDDDIHVTITIGIHTGEVSARTRGSGCFERVCESATSRQWTVVAN